MFVSSILLESEFGLALFTVVCGAYFCFVSLRAGQSGAIPLGVATAVAAFALVIGPASAITGQVLLGFALVLMTLSLLAPGSTGTP